MVGRGLQSYQTFLTGYLVSNTYIYIYKYYINRFALFLTKGQNIEHIPQVVICDSKISSDQQIQVVKSFPRKCGEGVETIPFRY